MELVILVWLSVLSFAYVFLFGYIKEQGKTFVEFTVKYIENLKNDEKIYASLLEALGGIDENKIT